MIGEGDYEQDFEPDETFPVIDPNTGEQEWASFSIRPYVKECLTHANKFFEVAIFTAGVQWFADPILDFLDPDRVFFQHRFYRHHTSELRSNSRPPLIFKDLEIFTAGEVSLSNILLVDNNIYSFALNLENGIPVQHYLGDKKDTCLLQVMNYLEYIKDFDNMAAANERIHAFRKVFNSNLSEFISFYDECSSGSECDDEESEVIITLSEYNQEEVKMMERNMQDRNDEMMAVEAQYQQKMPEVIVHRDDTNHQEVCPSCR